jgi:hypothetical protein
MAARKVTPDALLLAHFRATWERRTARQEQEGREWYDVARDECERIADASGYPLASVILAMAALSPNVPWSRNVTMCRSLAGAKRFRNPGTFPLVARQAWRCLHGDATANSGLKRRAFAAAIAGDVESVTIDRHMIALAGHPYYGISPQQYEHYAFAVTRFARSLGELPRDVQAILWTVQREAA